MKKTKKKPIKLLPKLGFIVQILKWNKEKGKLEPETLTYDELEEAINGS